MTSAMATTKAMAAIDKRNHKSPAQYVKAICIDLFLWSYDFIVLYKIVYQKLILDLRRPDFFWDEIIRCSVVGTVIALALFKFLPQSSIGRRFIFGVSEEEALIAKPWYKKGGIVFLLISLLLTFIAGLVIGQVSIYEFFSAKGLEGAKRIFVALFHPNFSIIQEVMFAAIETIYMAFIATAFAIPAAFLLSFFAARNLMQHHPAFQTIYVLVRFCLNLTRAIEPIIWAIILSVWVGIGPFSGMLALMLHSVASLAKLYSEQIESIDDGPMEAMTATGAHPLQVVWFGVVPQVVLPFLSYTIYRWDINVRMATIIGLVGGGGLGTLLMGYQGIARWNEVGMIVIVIAVIVWIMDYASGKIREALK